MLTKLRFFFHWSQGNAGTHFKISRGVRNRSRFGSVNAHDEQKRVKLRWIGHFAKRRSRISTVVVTATGEVQTNEEAQVFRSRSSSPRNCAITWRNACSPIVWKTVRRPRIFLWVGQRSKATIDQRREDYHLHDGQLRTSCRYRFIHQFWKRFVFNIAITGLVEKRGGQSSQETGAVHLQVQFQSEVTKSIQETCATTRKPQNNIKRVMTRKNRTTRWQIFLTGLKDFKANLKECRKWRVICRPEWQWQRKCRENIFEIHRGVLSRGQDRCCQIDPD